MKRKTGLVREIRERMGIEPTERIIEYHTQKDRPQANNEVVGYIDGKAIIEDDFARLYYVTMEEEFVTLGEVMLSSDLTPITELTEEEQLNIYKLIQGE